MVFRYGRLMPDDLVRRKFTVSGQVQGVGFRPFVYRIAADHALTGTVSNTAAGVFIEVQGPAASVDGFGHDLTHKLPPLARVVSCTHQDIPVAEGEDGFRIVASGDGGAGHEVLISADVATCDDCLADMSDPANRRHLYPFTNCTNCGPRYTITRFIPYDRDKTSMACFPLCPACAAEYENPLDRRFHAQPNACPVCGPRVWYVDGAPDGPAADTGYDAAPGSGRGDEPGCAPASDHGAGRPTGTPAIQALAEALAAGRIAAVKGLGGFHLACDAASDAAVGELRRRKHRPHKPLAIMVPDLAAARRIVHVSPEEEALLAGRERPIVLCRALDGLAGGMHGVARPGDGSPLVLDPDAPRTPPPISPLISPLISPDTPFVGVMLPYTPLHHVLLRLYGALLPEDRVPALVMTSGNAGGEPICLGNREALRRLSSIADVFLLHDRDILIRTDDSVTRVNPATGAPQFLRRARGFTPRPVFLEGDGPCVLAMGPELKNTLCVTRGDKAFVSQHIGDMHNLETLGFHREIAAHLPRILQVTPQAVVRDLHPDYMTTAEAEQSGLPVLTLQHHFAHIHAVLAENRHDGPALGLALDGTGHGDDGTVWGGELLYVDNVALDHQRLGRLARIPLPGGEAAIREPWRIAQGLLWHLGLHEPVTDGARPWPWLRDHAQAAALLPRLLERGVNTPLTSSCGRLFDAVSALLGLCTTVTYEGQAAIRLEHAQDAVSPCGGSHDAFFTHAYPCPLRGARDGSDTLVLDTHALFRAVHDDWARGTPPGEVARRFHAGVVAGLADMAAAVAGVMDVPVVALSGGAMQNLTLSVHLPQALAARGLTVLTHAELPPGDGCISLGQAAWARRELAGRG
uniref:acylphosphatase n=2 Tax=Nitratidesulfovibrio vulgaris (strain DSM 19637 / Miyazaki F) TaxID=883 RepID=B0LPC9_NITV9|nr:HypF [Nitratidesulfovibrio vulgaris str. 'Miyazaki F']